MSTNLFFCKTYNITMLNIISETKIVKRLPLMVKPLYIKTIQSQAYNLCLCTQRRACQNYHLHPTLQASCEPHSAASQ